MIKRLFALAALLTLAMNAFAEVRWGQVELAFFRMRGEDGQMVDLPTKGIVLPVKIETIRATPHRPTAHNYTPGVEQFFPSTNQVYLNDKGNGFYFYDPAGPSACDDINILPVGNGQWWYDLTVGCFTLNGNMSRKVMLRQLGWNTYVSGLGAGVSAVQGLVFDVGWVFLAGNFPPAPDPETAYKFTIPIHNYWAAIPNSNKPRVPNGLIYFAQEWRENHAQGEGAFITNDFAPVFCGGGDPTMGTSTDNYINDWDPQPNGIFDETENDFFGGPPNEANFLMGLVTQSAGVNETVKPSIVTLFRGSYVGGNVGSFHFVDANYYRANKGFVANPTENPIQIILEGFVSTAALTSASIDIESSFTNNSFDQIIEAWNYTTNAWVQVDRRHIGMTDTHVTVGIPGTASQFVDAPNGNVMKMKISFKQTTFVPNPVYGCKINLANWITAHP